MVRYIEVIAMGGVLAGMIIAMQPAISQPAGLACIGDSIMAGATLPEGAGTFCQNISPYFNADYVIFAYPGATTASMKLWMQHFIPTPGSYAVVMLGMNDLEQHENMSVFHGNLEYIVARLRENAVNVILVVPPNPDFSNATILKSFSKEDYESMKQAVYSAGRELSLKVIDFDGVLDSMPALRTDGVHPNSNGQTILAKEFILQCGKCFG